MQCLVIDRTVCTFVEIFLYRLLMDFSTVVCIISLHKLLSSDCCTVLLYMIFVLGTAVSGGFRGQLGFTPRPSYACVAANKLIPFVVGKLQFILKSVRPEL